MDTKKSLSWKYLIPIGIVLWAFGFMYTGSVIPSAIGLLGFLMTVLGIIDLIRSLAKKNK